MRRSSNALNGKVFKLRLCRLNDGSSPASGYAAEDTIREVGV